MDELVSRELIEKLATLMSFLSSNILGQVDPVFEIVNLLQRSFCGMRFPDHPIASMLFLGPTGVGKSESTLLLTKHIYGDPNKLVRFDMSEFMTLDSINILRGSSNQDRGLIGYYHNRSGGDGLILFDEIEKAHPLILDIFLQILSAGRFTASTGETMDLRNYVVVATTNIGSRMLMESTSTDRETIVRRALQAVSSEMRPEMFARFDLHCVFNKLGWETLKEIAVLHVNKCLDLINAQGHCVNIDDGVIEYVQREGFSEKYGARPMQNSAMRILGDVITKAMLKNHGHPVDGRITYDRRRNVCELV